MEKDSKKKRITKRVDGSKFIELNPTMNEVKSSTAVVTFGRFNPITIGHEKLANKISSEAKIRNATPMIFASHAFDKKKNPIPYESKIAYMQKAFGKIVQKTSARNIIEIAKELSSKFDNLVVVVGSDRVSKFQKLLNTYNGKEYDYKSIEVVSAGERDPDAEGVSGMSASKLRSFAASGNFDEFKKGLPSALRSIAKTIYMELRTNMGLEEEIVSEEALEEREALTTQQRRDRGRVMRRYKAKISAARKRARRRKATPEKLKQRARRKARELIRQRFLQGRNYGDLSPAEKVQIDKRVLKIPDSVIARISTRQLPKVRQAEIERISHLHSGISQIKKENLNDQFDQFIIERRECPPKRYHMAMNKEGNVKFDRRFKFFRKEPVNKLKEFFEDSLDLMEAVENYILMEKKLDKGPDDPCWDGYVQVGMKKKGNKEVPNCVPMESAFSNNPANREQGTDSLVRIYKKDTPGQKIESYFSNDIPEFSFQNLKRGSRVRFSTHSMDMADNFSEKEGTIVGSDVSHLRVRDDQGILYKVRHADAELVETTLSRGFEGKKITVKDEPVRMADGSMKKMPPGKSASSKHGNGGD
jgi:hypothetical protein